MRLEMTLEELKRENEQLKQDLAYAQDDLAFWANACRYCADSDIEDPWRHDHGDGKFHWHHRIDPGDGLASPCENSEQLERIFRDELGKQTSQRESFTKQAVHAFGLLDKVRERIADCPHCFDVLSPEGKTP